MSFGGGPRFDNSGPGPQVHDFEGADAEPQNLAVRDCALYAKGFRS